MTNESTTQPDHSSSGTPTSGPQPESVGLGPTPAQLLSLSPGTSADTPTAGHTPAQLLGVDPGLADSMSLGEPQARGLSLATDMGKAAGSSDTPDKKG